MCKRFVRRQIHPSLALILKTHLNAYTSCTLLFCILPYLPLWNMSWWKNKVEPLSFFIHALFFTSLWPWELIKWLIITPETLKIARNQEISPPLFALFAFFFFFFNFYAFFPLQITTSVKSKRKSSFSRNYNNSMCLCISHPCSQQIRLHQAKSSGIAPRHGGVDL